LDWRSVQALTFPFNWLHFLDRRRELNAVHWHTPTDLPPQATIMQIDMSTVCSLPFSLTFIQ
jgi:hypothetical protein